MGQFNKEGFLRATITDGNDNSDPNISLLWMLLTSFLIFNISFFVCNYLKRGSLALSSEYEKLLLVFYFSWCIASYVGKKFSAASYQTIQSGFFTIIKSALYLAYCVAFIVVISGDVKYSRLQIFSTCLTTCLFELIIWTIYYKIKNGKHFNKHIHDNEKNNMKNGIEKQASYFLVGFDLLLIMLSFFIVNFLKRGSLNLHHNYEKLLLLILLLWFVCSLITKKFLIKEHNGFYFSLWQWIKANALMLSMASVIVFGLRLFYFSRMQVFGSILMLLFAEMIVLKLYFWFHNEKDFYHDVESVEDVKKILSQETLSLNLDIETIRQKLMEPSRIKLQKKLGEKWPGLFEFINEDIDLDDIICMETAIENCSDLSVLNSDRIPVRLYINLHKVNDIRRINQYFLQVHQLLLPGGYYISWAHTYQTHYKYIYSKFPRLIANFVYLIAFCYKRIMPKLPGLKRLYFSLSKGRGRILSRAEVLGRLCFCGFEIVAETEINKKIFFITRKVKTPSLDQSPTYGPIIDLKRSGSQNKVIKTYKFRTMHPYSEYLQQYVYNMQGLKKGGKMDSDFRLTTWGKIMRKLWIDELPMLYNWMKGDLQLVGVRPLSPHYFSLYDEELQELRKDVKPGLIPPFYADLPETFEEICQSEKKYIQSFLKRPIKTQWIYFWKAFYNIVINGKRSN